MPIRGRVGERRGGKAAQTKEAILSAALVEFSTYGFETVTNRGVAARAGLTHGLIRYHFATKEEMWRQAVDFLFERQLRFMEGWRGDGSVDDAEQFRRFVRRFVDYCARHPEHLRIVLQEAVTNSPRFEWLAKKYTRANYDGIVPMLERLIAAGRLPNRPIVSLHFALSASCQNIFALERQYEFLVGRSIYDDDAIPRHAETVIDLFLRPAADPNRNAAASG
jgi:AcrR family transcriptional regulator